MESKEFEIRCLNEMMKLGVAPGSPRDTEFFRLITAARIVRSEIKKEVENTTYAKDFIFDK